MANLVNCMIQKCCNLNYKQGPYKYIYALHIPKAYADLNVVNLRV